MKHLTIIFYLVSFTMLVNAQKVKHGIENKLNLTKYVQSQEVVWYGWDFSNIKVCDSKIYSYVLTETLIPEWLEKLNNQFSINEMKRKLDKPIFSADLQTVQNLYKSKDYKQLLTSDKYELSLDSIKNIVSRYKLANKTGIGAVIILENINKPERYVSGYVTFFDIPTRELLWATKMKGLPGGKWGEELYYRNGLIEIYAYFFAKYYNKAIRNFQISD